MMDSNRFDRIWRSPLRHRLRLSALLLAAGLLAAVALPGLAAPGQPQPSPRPPAAPAQNFPPAGLRIDQAIIRPGEALPIIFGVVGPPDQVRAMRSKKEADDYVLFSYFAQGFSLDIGQNNRVQGILVESSEAVMDGVPFRVGATKATVMKAWGEPDRSQNNVLAYWRRGVYVGHDQAGTVVNVFLAPPGRTDEPDKGPAPVGG